MKRIIALVMAAMLCLTLFAGCKGTDESDKDLEKLIVGLDDTFAPMGFREEDGTLVGFDVDLATAVGKEMGVEIQFQPIDWDSKEMELEAKKVDCAWNGLSRTPDREENMTLSQNYLNNKIVIMTSKDVNITSKDQLKDYNIGIQAGSSGLELVKADEIYEDIKDKISEYPTYDECILDMQAGRLDAIVVDEVLGQYKNAQLDSDKKMNVASVNFGDDFYCIGFRKEDTELCKKVEKALKGVQKSGKGTEISKKWFGEDLMLEIE